MVCSLFASGMITPWFFAPWEKGREGEREREREREREANHSYIGTS